MGSETKRFHHRSLQDADSIVELLEALIEGIQKGKLTLTDDDDEVQLRPRGLLDLTIEAEDDSGRNSLNLRLRWNEAGRRIDRKLLKIR